MSNGPEFFQTIMGRKFFDADVPRAIRALEQIADALEQIGEALQHIAAEEYPVEVPESIEPKVGEQICCDDPDCPDKDGFGCTEPEINYCDKPGCKCTMPKRGSQP